MEDLYIATGASIITAGLCQALNYAVEGRPWHHAIFPPTLGEWIIPKCLFCWPARALVAASLVGFVFAGSHS